MPESLVAIKQAHRRAFWQHVDVPHNTHAYTLKPVITHSSCPTPIYHNDKAPDIYATISIYNGCIQLSYMIQRCDYIDFAPLSTSKPRRVDSLWLSNCLECFFALKNQPSAAYIEMNFATNGNFNLYHFTDYRTPTPPVETAGTVSVVWASTQNTHHGQYWERHLLITLADADALAIEAFNLSAILYHKNSNTPIYYAIQHANPPDFHDRTHWLTWMH